MTAALLLAAFAVLGVTILDMLREPTLLAVLNGGAALLDRAGFGEYALFGVQALLGLMLFAVGALTCSRSRWLFEAMGGNAEELGIGPVPNIQLSSRVRDQEIAGTNLMSKWVQIVVATDSSAPLVDCEVQIASIRRGDKVIYDEPLNCLWSNTNDIRRTIHPGIPQGANLFRTQEQQQGLRGTTSVGKPQIEREMRESGEYTIDVAVHAKDTKVEQRKYLLRYRDFDDIIFVAA